MTALRDNRGNLRGFAKVTRDISERRQAERAVRQLSARILRVQDDERRRIARELHDSTAQILSGLALNLALIDQCVVVARGSRAVRALAESRELADQAASEVRNLSHLLHPPDSGIPESGG